MNKNAGVLNARRYPIYFRGRLWMLLIFIAAFILIAAKGLTTPQPGDENVYYYMGRLISEGKLPYKDFFYAHPPLHIYLISLLYKIFGFNIIILKSVPLASAIISAILIFCIAKKKYGIDEAAASALLYLFSYSVMFNSVFSFGIDIAVMLLLAGIYFLWNRNSLIMSGIFFGLAGITRLLSLVPISIIFIAASLSNKKNFIKLLSAFLMVFLSVNALFALFAGKDYLNQVYRFHLLKSSEGGDNFKEYIGTLKLNWILFLSAALFVFAREKRKAGIFAIIAVAYLLFLFALKKVFGFYFLVVFPFLAIIGGYSILTLFKSHWRDIVSLLSTKKILAADWQAEGGARSLSRAGLKIFLWLAFLMIFAWNLTSDVMFLERIGFSGFERGKDMADFVKSNSGKGTLLFGDESVVPLLAMMTDKKIALDFVDTNNQVFISGIKNLKATLSLLKGKDVLFIIRSRQGISYFVDTRDFLSKNCELLSSFHDKLEGDYLVYRCG